jgi:hypothetical protein
MTLSEHKPDDRALDAMLETIARANAPRNFAARLSAALDARHAIPVAGRRVRFVMAAAAGVLAIVVSAWIASRHVASPSAPALSSRSAPTSAAHTSPAPGAVPQSTIPDTTALALAAARTTHVTQPRSLSREDDHDRALPALASLPGLGPRDISPATLHTAPLEIDRIDDIAPLTIQSGRETGGRGDF